MFAQLECETIQKRVSDAYYSRSQKGFRMGGKPPYGYRLEEILMEGIHTKKLVEEPGEAAIVREIFDMYQILCRKGSAVLWKGTDTFHAGPAFEKSGICAG